MFWMEYALAPRQVNIALFFLFSINVDKEIIPKMKFTPRNAMITKTKRAVEKDSINVLYDCWISYACDSILNLDSFSLSLFISEKKSFVSSIDDKKTSYEYEETGSSSFESMI